MPNSPDYPKPEFTQAAVLMQKIESRVDQALDDFLTNHKQDEGLPEFEKIHSELDSINGKLEEFEGRLKSLDNQPSIEELFLLDTRADTVVLELQNYGKISPKGSSKVN